MENRTNLAYRSLLWGTLIPAFILMAGCSSGLPIQGDPGPGSAPQLILRTQDGARFVFTEASWRLDWSGIEGRAAVHPSRGPSYIADTTISYLAVAAVDSRGEDPWTQLLLTILGVILVIGLAGIILYAAFRATER